VETVRRLTRACKNIVGIKEAGGNADRVSQLRAALGPKFEILSGDDALTLPFMAVGAQGVISVASNVIPREISKMVRAYAAGDVRTALKVHEQYYQFVKDLFIETNPVPVKAALAMLGHIQEHYRLPLTPMAAKNREVLRVRMKKCGILK
jgi:4-hydroxy-tetrahydrodipicolinate synthase